jgi:hypothetical protein
MNSSLHLTVVASVASLTAALVASPAATGAEQLPSVALLERQALPPVPPKPRITATRVGKRVRISYSFAVWPSDPDRRPVQLITAVQSSGTRYGPLHKEHRITKRRGVVWQPLGLGSAPFKLHAAAYSRFRSSPTVTVLVRNG